MVVGETDMCLLIGDARKSPSPRVAGCFDMKKALTECESVRHETFL